MGSKNAPGKFDCYTNADNREAFERKERKVN